MPAHPPDRQAAAARNSRRWWLAAALLGVVVAGPGCAAWRLSRSVELARQSEPFQQPLQQPVLRMLVIGDSTAVGTGASRPETSLVGLMARSHPQLQVDNRARDGASWADLPAQMPTLATGAPRYDVVLIQAGGNDVIRLHDLDAVAADIEQVVARASVIGRTVIVMPSGNVGNAPMVFAPLSWWLSHRSRALHRSVKAAAVRHGARYVNLYHAPRNDPFVQQPGLFAADGLHPSDAGYASWWRELRQQSGLDALLAPAR